MTIENSRVLVVGAGSCDVRSLMAQLEAAGFDCEFAEAGDNEALARALRSERLEVSLSLRSEMGIAAEMETMQMLAVAQVELNKRPGPPLKGRRGKVRRW